MGTGNKQRWKISIYRSSSKPQFKKPPEEFLCPISATLMADPVIVSSGHTFERNSVQACKTLGFNFTLKDGSIADFSGTLIPNLALKSTIVNYARQPLVPIDHESALKLVQSLIQAEELRNVREIPDPNIGHAESELNRRLVRLDSDDWGVNSMPVTPLQLTTFPSCFSPATTASGSEIEASGAGSGEEDEVVAKMRSPKAYEQEEGVSSLRRSTRGSIESRVSLCTPRILSSLRSLVVSKYTNVQVNSVAALVNLSLENANKVKIVRSGMISPLIDVLRGGFPEAQEHACGAIFSLALADENKTAIGVLGALQPLIHMMRSESERARNDATLALYHLSLVQSNRSKLVKLGAVHILMSMLKSSHMPPGRILLVLCNIGACDEGRAAMLDACAVECLVGMIRRGEFESESVKESCVAAIFALSRGGGLRFKVVAKKEGVVEALRGVVGDMAATERAREKGRRVMEILREKDEEEEYVDWEKLLGLGLARACGPDGPNSTGF